MAVVQGMKEKLQWANHDAIRVDPGKQLRDVENSSTLKFFVNVEGKTKLETNLQSASLLPHYNTFEARAMRVVISDLPPEYPEETKGKCEDLAVTNERDEDITLPIIDGKPVVVTATLETGLDLLNGLAERSQGK